MTPAAERYTRLREVFQTAADLPSGERDAFLAKECGQDEALRHEVEVLLETDAHAGSFGEQPILPIPAELFLEGVEEHFVGRQFGAYQIVREIGRGGLGVIFLAVRADGEFSKEVAIKLIRRGLDTDDILRRFRAERQILAQLDHPGIARLIDAGSTEEGLPFFIMEYVRGEPLDRYCDVRRLGVKARLDLFRRICAAVTYAHQNLVIHRDLKPSNILVTAEGEPKLLDFGIARLLAAEEDIFTQTAPGLRAMTPDYASPEQIRGEKITTASDVYSLGVVLYELLTGEKPYRIKERTTEEIMRAIAEQEPERPSTAALRSGSFQLASQSNLKSRATSLRGDLDNIVLMAMRKEPQRRYSSAAVLAEDIRRHQEGLTVSARPSTFRSRSGKFIRRHRAGVAAAALVLLAIVAGLIATLWQAGVARSAQARAEKRFNDVRTLANSFLFEFSPKIENLPGSMPARRLLVTRALEYLGSLSQESAGDLQLQSELAKAYEKVGDVQGNPQTANIGDLQGALESYKKAQAIRRRLLAADPHDAEKQADLAGNLEIGANINLNGGESDKAEPSLAEAVALREKVLAKNSQDVAARGNLGNAVRLSSYVPFYNSQNEKAMELSRRALAIFAGLSRELPDDAPINMRHANIYIDIGEVFGYLDDKPQAQENLQKGLDMLAALYQKFPNDNRIRRAFFISCLKRGELYRDSGDLENSLVNYDRALELSQTALRIDLGSFQAKRDLVVASKQRANTLQAAKRFNESVEGFSRAIETSEQLKREDPNNILVVYDLAGSYYDMSETYYLSGDHQSTFSATEKAQENCREVLTKNPAHTMSKNVMARSKNLAGKVYAAFAEKNGQTDSWKKALENYHASLEIYHNLKAEGKFTVLDSKRVADLEAAIGEAENNLGKVQ